MPSPDNENYDIERLIDSYSTMVLRQAYFYLRDKQRAEDAMQEVFIRMMRKKPDLPDEQSEKAYILRVTINVCKDYLKSAWNRKVSYIKEGFDMPNVGKGPESQIVQSQENQALFDCVMDLPKIYKDVIVLFYYHDMPTEQIAKILSIPGVTVRTRLMRARERLKDMLRRRTENT